MKKRVSLLALLLTLVCLNVPTPSSAQAEVVSENEKTFGVFVDANPCTGEPMETSGYLHEVYHVVTDPNGRLHVSIKTNAQGLEAVGLVSGERYRAIAADSYSSNQDSDAATAATRVITIKFVNPGGGDNFVVRIQQHITINSNGEVTTIVDHGETECR